MSEERGSEEVRKKAQADLEEGKERARKAAGQAKAEAEARVESGSRRAAENVDEIAEAVGTAASRLSDSEHESLAQYANQLASHLSGLSARLRERNVDELAADVRNIARRNPALFVLGSVAVGIGLSRFAKASRKGGDSRRAGAAESEWGEELGGDAATARAEREASEHRITPDATGGSGL